MIARATLAILLAGPVFAAGATVGCGTAVAHTVTRKPGQNAAVHRDKTTTTSHRRVRSHQTVARAVRQDPQPAAIVASLDDGLAYDTPRDANGRPIRGEGSGWQVGTASWYGGPQWQGRRMSDGARYEQNDLTAAHVSLPLGTRVRVTLANSDRSVVVRITDRPGTRKRIIDLSRGAAAQLGMLSMGVAQVRLDPL